MNLIVLASSSPFAAYVIQEVERACPIQRVIRPVLSQSPTARSDWSRLKEAPVSGLLTGLRIGFYTLQRKRLYRKISQDLFASKQWPMVPASEFPSWAINGTDVVNLLRELAPDVMLVCGGPILRPKVFSIPRLGTLNIHFGISPKYRGEHTLFWPLRLADYGNIGVTLHYINEGVDTGHVLAQGFPALDRRDTEATIWAKCARMAASFVIEFLDAASSGPVAGQPQPAGGAQIRFLDRRVWMDARYQLERSLLRRRPPNRTEHGEMHMRPTVAS